jgi:hypothetical protein
MFYFYLHTDFVRKVFYSGMFENRAETLLGLHVMWSLFLSSEKLSNVQFHQNPFSSSRIVTGRNTVILIDAPQGRERT